MSRRFLACILLLTAVSVLGQNRSAAPASGKAWTPPRTPSGEPDLEGVWTSTTTAPLERPAQFGDRLFLSDQEFAEIEKRLLTQRESDGVETLAANARATTGPPDHWT